MKNKTGGVVTSTVMGIGGLVIAVIIVLVILGTIDDSTLFGTPDTTGYTVSNETDAYMNASGYTLAVVNGSNSAYTITAVWNLSTAYPITSGNYTVSSAGVFTNASESDFSTNNFGVNISYTYTWTDDDTVYQRTVDNMTGNFTEGLDNISEKIPTILLLVAVVFLFGALALLIRASRNMGIGTGSSL